MFRLTFYRTILSRDIPDVSSPQHPATSCDISPHIPNTTGCKYLAIIMSWYIECISQQHRLVMSQGHREERSNTQITEIGSSGRAFGGYHKISCDMPERFASCDVFAPHVRTIYRTIFCSIMHRYYRTMSKSILVRYLGLSFIAQCQDVARCLFYPDRVETKL